MRQLITLIVILQCFKHFCEAELSFETKGRYLNAYVDYLNNLPNQAYTYDDGILLNSSPLATNDGWKIETRVRANDIQNLEPFKYLKCTGTVRENAESGISIDNDYQCLEDVGATPAPVGDVEDLVTETPGTGSYETPAEHEPVKLDNEVQTDTAVTSGEQFIAVPRDRPSAPCIGCSTYVNPEAEGVSVLASLGVSQLDSYEPEVGHTLNKVVSVERQVQAVNGVRYILTLLVDYNSCFKAETETCLATNACKVSVLEKPWVKLPDGSKYRSIVANNCTADWIFRDGEQFAGNTSDNGEHNKTEDLKPTPNTGSGDDLIAAVHHTDVQSQIGVEKLLTDDEIRNIEEQIIPNNQFSLPFPSTPKPELNSYNINQQEIPHVETAHVYVDKSAAVTTDHVNVNQVDSDFTNVPITEDKRKTIDELIKFFEFDSFQPKVEEIRRLRMKRSFDNDLKTLNLAEKFNSIRNGIENAKQLYILAQILVDHLNEMDLEVKNRIVQDVLSAEEESDSYQQFYYLKVRVVIPCEKFECDKDDELHKICSGVIDSTNNQNPQVLSVFCYDDKKKKNTVGKIREVPLNDNLLKHMSSIALKKIESESQDVNALKIIKILGANTQKVSGILTRIAMLVGYTNCDKTELITKRTNCTVIENLGTKVCNVEVLQRKWIRDQKVTYVCTKRPLSESFNSKKRTEGKVDDKSVLEVVQEALQYLEVQSNKNNKQKLAEIKSVSTQLIAGLLTSIEFSVGYTVCTNDVKIEIESCEFIKSEPLRNCRIQVWQRPWLEDGRQMNVTCDDDKSSLVIDDKTHAKLRTKRSAKSGNLDHSFITGSPMEQNPNDSKYRTLAEESLQKYVQTSGRTQAHKITTVDSVVTQVVSGSLTKINFTVVADDDVIDCHSKIWEQSWLKKKEIDVNCEILDKKVRSKRHIPGGEIAQNKNDPKYRALAEESLQKYMQTSGSTQLLKVTTVDEVTTQVVAGSLTKIDFTVNAANSDVIRCHSEIWEQPWLKKKEINVNCEIQNKKVRSKRQVFGGETAQNTNDPEYRALAEESLQKYVQTSGRTQAHKITTVDSVVTQVVSGSLTKINFTVVADDDVIDCHSKIWEQSWLKKKEIDVNCEILDKKVRSKRQIPGGGIAQNKNDPKYRALAEESLQKYMQTSGSTQLLKVTTVDEVTTQVVSGIITRIDFTVNAANSDVIRCHSEIWEQPWLKKKEINVNCEIQNKKVRSKRQVFGGETAQNTNDPEYRALAEESLQKYVQTSGRTQAHKITTVDSVVTQVVSGSLTKINFTVVADDDVIDCHSKIWEQSWLKKKEIDVNCEILDKKVRSKRHIPGGEIAQNKNDPKYRALAEESLQKYMQTSGSTQLLKVTTVDKVTTQVVSGIITRIDFTVNAANFDVIRCHSEIWEQSWLEKKEINVNCKIQSKKVRSKRQVFGGETAQNTNDPEYRALAEESLQKYVQTSGRTQAHKITTVDSVVTQVVSGSLTKINFTVVADDDVIDCHSKIWEQSWLKKKEIDVNCEILDKKVRSKRHIPGGEIAQNKNDPKYRALAEESLQKYMQTSGSTQLLKVTTVDEVTTQVVSGIITRIDFTVNAANFDVIRCHSEIWEQSWLEKKEINVNCKIQSKKVRSKRQVFGGETAQNTNDPEYRALAEESLQKYVQTSGRTQAHKITTVDSVVTQVVSGSLTKINFTVVADDDVIDCHSKIWEQSWLKKKEIDVNCEILDKKVRSKRHIPGGEIAQNKNDPKYRALAEESLQKYMQTSGSTQLLKVTTVDKVTTQVVAGSLTKIDFTVNAANSDVIRCHSEIWEQPWLKKKEINVDCKIQSKKVRSKRQNDDDDYDLIPNEGISGGWTSQDPDSAEYINLAQDSWLYFNKYGTRTQSNYHKVVRVKKVTTQVAAGVITRLTFLVSPTECLIKRKGRPSYKTCSILDPTNVQQCSAEVTERSWLKIKRISVDCKKGRNKREILSNKFRKHNTRLVAKVGSFVEQNSSKPEFKKLADESLEKYQQMQFTDIRHEVKDVKRVFTKIVSGTLYKIDYTATPSKSKAKSLVSDQPDEKSVLYCHAEIWDRPWLRRKSIDVSCNMYDDENILEDDEDIDIRLKRELLGGSVLQDGTADRYHEMAEIATKKFQKQSKSQYRFKVVKIENVHEQVINGFYVTIEFTISPTTCLTKNTNVNIKKCPIQKENMLLCSATIQERVALDFDSDVNIKCKLKSGNKKMYIRPKREIPSIIRQNQVDEDDYIDEDTKFYYAERAVQYLNDNSGSQNIQKLITIHSAQSSMQMKTHVVRMYIETAYTYCLRDESDKDNKDCDELDGMGHRLCLAKLFPSNDDEFVINRVNVVCEDDEDFAAVTGLSIPGLVAVSLRELEKSPNIKYKLVHQGEPNIAPSLDSNVPVKVHFVMATTNCTKELKPTRDRVECYVDATRPVKSCLSFVWLVPNTRTVKRVIVKCREPKRYRRAVTQNPAQQNSDDLLIQQFVQESLDKLEMSSLHRYKQRVIQVNSYSTKITTGKVTTIDFDVGYTNCLKYEWIDNVTRCEFLEHLPRRHCVSQVWERLWLQNGRNIDVNCEDDETPLESRIEFENAEIAMQLAKQAIKHIEAKYPHPKKQQVVRIFSLDKQLIAGMHFRMKIEVGFTNCTALSLQTNCEIQSDGDMNRFCRVNVWVRPWTDHPPNFRVSCDYLEGVTTEFYHHVQAEQLFFDFLTTYRPGYINDHVEMEKRFEIFRANVRKIHELNTHEKGTATYAVTRFADLSEDEFRSKYLGLKPSLRNPNQVPMREAQIPKVDVPEKFDWRDQGAVTEVKDQGSCGSCWAFSVTGNIEGQWKLKSGKLVSLSEQELVDCDKLDEGCNGGLPDNAYRAIEQLGGLETEDDYPYEGDDDKCVFNKTLTKVQISGAVNISSNETDMAKWLVHNGPISIGINANAMQFYVGGVSHPWKMLCNPKNLDHGVLIVGYGVKDYPLFHKRLPYWIVKNSWGKSWGEQGYYRVFRGDGTCGVNQMASSAVV